MKKILKYFLFVHLLLGAGFVFAPQVSARAAACSSILRSSFNTSGFPATVYDNHPYASSSRPVAVSFGGLDPNENWTVTCTVNGVQRVSAQIQSNANGTSTWNLTDNSCFSKVGDAFTLAGQAVDAEIEISKSGTNIPCTALPYRVESEAAGVTCAFDVVKDGGGKQGCFMPNDTINWSVQIRYVNGEPYRQTVQTSVSNLGGFGGANTEMIPNSDGILKGVGNIGAGNVGNNVVVAINKKFPGFLNADDIFQLCSSTPVPVQLSCTDEEKDQPNPASQGSEASFSLCGQIPASAAESEGSTSPGDACCQCMTGNGGSTLSDNSGSPNSRSRTCSNIPANGEVHGLWTAVGCIPTSPQGIVSSFLRIGLSIAGGVALLMILGAGFMLSTSQGQPEQANKAREMITSAVVGLLFIIFSVTLLQFIGVSIFQLPGFGT